MKNKIIKVAILVLITVMLLFGIITIFQSFFMAEPNIIQTHQSPDLKYVAYIYESNGGATTGWTYHISILPANKKIGKGNGNIYVSDSLPEYVKWTNDKELYICDYSNINTTKRKEKLHDIIIKYRSTTIENNSN